MTFLIIILLIFWGVSSPESLLAILMIVFFGSIAVLFSKTHDAKREKEKELEIIEEERIFLENDTSSMNNKKATTH